MLQYLIGLPRHSSRLTILRLNIFRREYPIRHVAKEVENICDIVEHVHGVLQQSLEGDKHI